MTRLAQELFVAVFIAATHPERSLMVDGGAHGNPALAMALLAQAAVSFANPITILDARPTPLTLHRI